MSKRIPEIISIALVVLSLVAFALLLAFRPGPNHAVEIRYGDVIHEESSDFSTIRIRENGSMRSLLFVDPEGLEQCQSSIDLEHPGELMLGYSKTIFASHLFVHPQERVLVVGLGAGGMVQFMNDVFQKTFVEAVEIDPVVVRLANEFFGTKDSSKLKIHTADAFDFIEKRKGGDLFDVVYMDAFLRAPEATGLDRKTKRLKTVSFLEDIAAILTENGAVAFNLIEAEKSTPADLESIQKVFPQVEQFSVPGTGNLVVIALKREQDASISELRERAGKLDQAVGSHVSFAPLIDSIRE
jgi:spermidine synthase